MAKDILWEDCLLLQIKLNFMEKYKAGDKVKFLNEKGGGVVVRNIDSRLVLVAIDDGFEIPVMVSDLVLDPAAVPERKKQAMEVAQREVLRQEQEKEEEADAARKRSLRRFARNPEPEGIYLAFVPHDQQWLLTGPIDVTLVNHSNTELLYSFGIKLEDGLENADFGQVSAYSSVVIETISREDLNSWSSGLVQALLVEEHASQPLMPLHAPYEIKANRFFKEGSYTSSVVLGEKALVVNLQLIQALRIDDQKTRQFKKDGLLPEGGKANVVVKEKQIIDKHRTAAGEAVVDLHIAELVENIAGLSSRDMLNIQLDYFNKCLDSAMVNEYDKVTFIHGVGNGVLKNAIVNALSNYEGTSNRMASMSKFGVGAIDVLLKDKE
jgi:hypothetical protein